MAESKAKKFRFDKEFTEEMYNEVKIYYGKSDSDTIRKLLIMGYKLWKRKDKNIKSILDLMDEYDVSKEDLLNPNYYKVGG